MTKAESEIKQFLVTRKITKRQHDSLMKHVQHHTFAHIRKMLDLMESGETFTASHKDAMKTIAR